MNIIPIITPGTIAKTALTACGSPTDTMRIVNMPGSTTKNSGSTGIGVTLTPMPAASFFHPEVRLAADED